MIWLTSQFSLCFKIIQVPRRNRKWTEVLLAWALTKTVPLYNKRILKGFLLVKSSIPCHILANLLHSNSETLPNSFFFVCYQIANELSVIVKADLLCGCWKMQSVQHVFNPRYHLRHCFWQCWLHRVLDNSEPVSKNLTSSHSRRSPWKYWVVARFSRTTLPRSL